MAIRTPQSAKRTSKTAHLQVSGRRWLHCQRVLGCPVARQRGYQHQRGWARPCLSVLRPLGCQQQLLCHQHPAGHMPARHSGAQHRVLRQQSMETGAWLVACTSSCVIRVLQDSMAHASTAQVSTAHTGQHSARHRIEQRMVRGGWLKACPDCCARS